LRDLFLDALEFGGAKGSMPLNSQRRASESRKPSRVEPRNSIVARKLLVRKRLEMRQALSRTGKSRREQLEILLKCP
jgi:hypothetical protein